MTESCSNIGEVKQRTFFTTRPPPVQESVELFIDYNGSIHFLVASVQCCFLKLSKLAQNSPHKYFIILFKEYINHTC
jgi:hypothetical protein